MVVSRTVWRVAALGAVFLLGGCWSSDRDQPTADGGRSDDAQTEEAADGSALPNEGDAGDGDAPDADASQPTPQDGAIEDLDAAVDELDATIDELDATIDEHDATTDGQDGSIDADVGSDEQDSSVDPIPGFWMPAPGALPASGNYVYLEGTAGDPVLGPQTRLYTHVNAALTVEQSSFVLSAAVDAADDWTGSFAGPVSREDLEVGVYADAQRYSLYFPGLHWSGEDVRCDRLNGWFVVDEISYENYELSSVHLRFEQRCNGSSSALHGVIHWRADQPSAPSGPVAPPAGLWSPAPGSTPASGNYVYLSGEPGNPIVGDRAVTFTDADAIVDMRARERRLDVTINGDEKWFGTFEAMESLTMLAPGYYGDLRGYPFEHNPLKGGLWWLNNDRECDDIRGWFVVDEVAYEDDLLSSVHLRFEQRCGRAGPALHGVIHWRANDPTMPPGPSPLPGGLWAPPAGSTPATGNYVYLEGDAGDLALGDRTLVYTLVNSGIVAGGSHNHFELVVNGDESWRGAFDGRSDLALLEVGYYGNLRRAPFHDPTRGGLVWHNFSSVCDALRGWFAIDQISYDGDAVSSIDLRFEEHCGGGTPALRGAIHWQANDPTVPPGPTVPPADLWQPTLGSPPATGSYIHLEREAYEIYEAYVATHTQADALITVAAQDASVSVSIEGDELSFGDFIGMAGLTALEPGYYSGLRHQYPFNTAKGGIRWIGAGGGDCDANASWFAVDDIAYEGDALSSIHLRFAVVCPDLEPPLHGVLHWSADDPTAPPGPVTPVPLGLWQPAPGATPASGNYVHLQSTPGDYIFGGETATYDPSDGVFEVSHQAGYLYVQVADWTGQFQAMLGLSRLEPGYYAAQEFAFQNPTRASINWYGMGRGCGATGWFAVDHVAYEGGMLTAIDLRFEQNCNDSSALFGAVHYAVAP